MALEPKQKRYLERFFPGLIAAVESLGAGAFESERAELRQMGDGLRCGCLVLNSKVCPDGHAIEATTMHCPPGTAILGLRMAQLHLVWPPKESS